MAINVYKTNPIDLLPDVAVGIMLPMTDVNGTLFKLSYTTQEQAISNLKNLLLTIQGERPMQPFFGTDIQKMLFNQITANVLERIENSVRTAINYWLPYIILNDLEIEGQYGSDIGMEEQGIYLRLWVTVTDNGPNIPITIFYTPTIIQVIE